MRGGVLHGDWALGWAFVPICLAAACGDSAPPKAPADDAGRPRQDGGFIDAGDGDHRTDGGPVLPPADDEVILPFNGEATVYPMKTMATLGRLDVAFSIDATASFHEEIANIQGSLGNRIAPALRARVRDTQFAVASFQDFPIDPFGREGDQPFRLFTAMTDDTVTLRNALAHLADSIGDGGDPPEAGAEALYQVATGEGLTSRNVEYIAPYRPADWPSSGPAGGVGYRNGSLRVVVHITDAPTHAAIDYADAVDGVHGPTSAATALLMNRVRLVGIASGTKARAQLETWAEATGAVVPPNADGACETGYKDLTNPPNAGQCPLVYDVAPDGDGLSDALVDGVIGLVDTLAFERVEGAVEDGRLQFVKDIVPNHADAGPSGKEPSFIFDADDDSDADAFGNVYQGAMLFFDVKLRNTTVRETDHEQSFRIRVQIVGDGFVMAERTLRIVVPAEAQ